MFLLTALRNDAGILGADVRHFDISRADHMGELRECRKQKGIKSKTIADKNLCTSERCWPQVVKLMRTQLKRRLRKEPIADPTELQPEIREATVSFSDKMDSHMK